MASNVIKLNDYISTPGNLSPGTNSGSVFEEDNQGTAGRTAANSVIRPQFRSGQSSYYTYLSEELQSIQDLTRVPGEDTGSRLEYTVSREKAPILKPIQKVAIEDVYPDTTLESASLLNAALDLIARAVSRLKEAEQASLQNEIMEADDEIQHLQMQLPEMFCLREIGKGYAAIVNAVWLSLENRAGAPLRHDQIVAIKTVMEQLQRAPFIRFKEALNMIDLLEDHGFETDPPALRHLADRYEDSDS